MTCKNEFDTNKKIILRTLLCMTLFPVHCCKQNNLAHAAYKLLHLFMQRKKEISCWITYDAYIKRFVYIFEGSPL